MIEEQAKIILREMIQNDLSLYDLSPYVSWVRGDNYVILDATFTVEELEAIVWWIKNKG